MTQQGMFLRHELAQGVGDATFWFDPRALKSFWFVFFQPDIDLVGWFYKYAKNMMLHPLLSLHSLWRTKTKAPLINVCWETREAS